MQGVFLNTLGCKSDKVKTCTLITARAEDITPPPDKRGRHNPPNKILSSGVSAHIKSFNPAIIYYRRELAPNRPYRPFEITKCMEISYQSYHLKK